MFSSEMHQAAVQKDAGDNRGPCRKNNLWQGFLTTNG